MKRLFFSLWLAVLAVTCSVAFAANSQVIKIVSSLPRTGSANAQSTTLVNGIKIAIDEVGGKIGDYTLAYEDWDDASPERGQWDLQSKRRTRRRPSKTPTSWPTSAPTIRAPRKSRCRFSTTPPS